MIEGGGDGGEGGSPYCLASHRWVLPLCAQNVFSLPSKLDTTISSLSLSISMAENQPRKFPPHPPLVTIFAFGIY